MSEALTDREIGALLDFDPAQGWRAFIDQYTPLMLGRLERAGVRDHDEKLEIYTLVCERLAANACARLRARRADEGALAAWLAVVVKHAVVDWVRSRAGRRRIFAALKALSERDQQVFELYYWEERRVSEIAGVLSTRTGGDTSVADVMQALGRVNATLTSRHRAELVAAACRARPSETLEGAGGELHVDVPGEGLSPEAALIEREQGARLEAALARLPAEDAAVLRLHVEQGLSLAQVRQALRLPSLDAAGVARIVKAARVLLGESA